MNLLQRFFLRRRRSRRELVLLGGVRSVDPSALMEDMTELREDVERAVKANKPHLKQQVLVRVEETLTRCRQFVELGEFTYVQMDSRSFGLVDLSTEQELALMMIPLLMCMKKELSE